jgi:hypothetical protein
VINSSAKLERGDSEVLMPGGSITVPYMITWTCLDCKRLNGFVGTFEELAKPSTIYCGGCGADFDWEGKPD